MAALIGVEYLWLALTGKRLLQGLHAKADIHRVRYPRIASSETFALKSELYRFLVVFIPASLCRGEVNVLSNFHGPPQGERRKLDFADASWRIAAPATGHFAPWASVGLRLAF